MKVTILTQLCFLIRLDKSTDVYINIIYTNFSVNFFGGVFLSHATLTLGISKKLKDEMKELKSVNWSEETRQFLEERVNRLKVLKKLDDLTKNSELTEEDAIEFGKKIKAGIAKRHGL